MRGKKTRQNAFGRRFPEPGGGTRVYKKKGHVSFIFDIICTNGNGMLI